MTFDFNRADWVNDTWQNVPWIEIFHSTIGSVFHFIISGCLRRASQQAAIKLPTGYHVDQLVLP